MNQSISDVQSSRFRTVATAMLFASLALPCLADDAAEQFATDAVHIEGKVKTSPVLSVEDLKKLPVTALAQVPMRCSPTREKGTSDYRGVLLREVLDLAQVDVDEHHSRNRTHVAVVASDGYSVIFSWHELYNSDVGDGVLLFYERNGQALGPEEGRIALLSARDHFTCGRHVKWVEKIKVFRFDES